MCEWLNKLWYIHTTRCYATLQEKDEDLYELTWNNLHDILLNEEKKSKAHKGIYMMLPFM